MCVTLGVVALALAVLTAGFYIALSQQLENGADAVIRSQADALASRVSVDGGVTSVEPSATATDSQTSAAWVYDTKGGSVLRSPGSLDLEDEATRLAGVTEPTFAGVGDDVRLFAEPVTINGATVGTVVVSQLRAPYERTEAIALRGAIILDLLVLAGVGLLASWLLIAALRPVDTMTKQAEEWSAHDLDRRFGMGPPHDELTQLAATLDGLLERLAASLRHEQNLTNEIAHELRTPIARLRAEAEVALRRPRTSDELQQALREVVEETEALDGAVQSLLDASRRDPARRNGTCDAAVAANAAADAVRVAAAARGVGVDVVAEGHLVVGNDESTVVRTLAPLLDNAVAHAVTSVKLTLERTGSTIEFAVVDDGPGVPDDELENIFVPGIRGAVATANHANGHGLGLALSRRLARSGGGDVAARSGPGGTFVLTLPVG